MRILTVGKTIMAYDEFLKADLQVKIPATTLFYRTKSSTHFRFKSPSEHLNQPRVSFSATSEELAHGGTLFLQYCWVCHGNVADDPGALPDLAYSSEGVHKVFNDFVLKGLLLPNGMPNLKNRLSKKDVTDIHNYILATFKQQIAKEKSTAK